ncbi:GGDEF domain-containing protein [Acidovorax lacteus]|uniref:diguanylate cyclase n=1 Tax=Acidovorax lacteus TaxID=1924988 RepID=A0ABP8LAU3_9BURK
MSALHVPTLAVVLTLVAFALALAVGLAAWGQREPDGLGVWGAGLALMGLSFGVLLALGWLPWPRLGLATGNALLAASYATALWALAGFRHTRWPWWRVLAPVAMVAAVSWVLADRPVLRFGVLNALFALQWVGLLLATHRWRDAMPGRGRCVLMLGAALVLAVFLLRLGALALGHTALAKPFEPHPVQSAAFLLGLTGLVVLTVGYVLMSKERVDADHVQEALIDALTGVPNRKALLEQLHRTLAQAAREQRPVAVLMLDIDRFKRVNDTWGHVAGDAVLAAVAQCLKGGLRAQDFLGRYGGEEFLVVLPGTGEVGAATLAEHLRTRVERLVVPWEPEDIRVTISIGVHVMPLATPSEMQALIDAADHAMYTAKRTGRNRVVVSGSPDELPREGSAPPREG